jgi:hypothetical protein
MMILAAVGGGACSSGNTPTISQPATSASTTPRPTTSAEGTATTGAAESDEDAIKRQYLAFWETRFGANENPPSSTRPFDDVATGKQLERTQAETSANRDAGLAFRRPQNSVARRSIEVREVAGDSADITDCAVSDGIVYRVATGEVVSSSTTTRSIDAVMRRSGGVWRLESTRVLQEWEGVAGCALAS